MKERQYLRYEAGLLDYPNDYVTTSYSKKLYQDELKGLMIQHQLKPKSKRMDINRFFVNEMNPWDMQFNDFDILKRNDFILHQHELMTMEQSEKKLVKCELFAFNGRPERFSFIHIPTLEQIEQFKTQPALQITALDQNVIGRIIKGGYSLRRGIGYGIGFYFIFEKND